MSLPTPARYAASRSTCTTTMSTRGARQAANSIVQSFAEMMRTRKLGFPIGGAMPNEAEFPSALSVSSWVFLRARRVMNVQSKHWLDYDPVALVVLVVGMSVVALLALSI